MSTKCSNRWPADGQTQRSPARLFITETTTKTHVGRILAKLGLRDRVHAVVYAYESSVVIAGDDHDAE